MSSSGTVKFFNTKKGYGFVKETDSEKEYFVHSSDIEGQALKEGDMVQFEVGESNDGRRKAIKVTGGTGGDPRARQSYNSYGGNRGGQGGFGGGYQQGGQGGFGGNSGGYGGNQGGYGGNSGGYGGQGQGGFGGGNRGGFGGDGGNKVCYNFRDNGQCRFGDQCRFSHETN